MTKPPPAVPRTFLTTAMAFIGRACAYTHAPEPVVAFVRGVVQLVAVVFFVTSYVFTSGFFLIPLLAPQLNVHKDRHPARGPMPDYLTLLALKACVIAKCCLSTSVLDGLYWRLLDRMEKRHGAPANAPLIETPLPEFDWRSRAADDFWLSYVQDSHPVVLRGFAAGFPCIKALSLEDLMSKYGDEVVLVNDKRESKEGAWVTNEDFDKVRAGLIEYPPNLEGIVERPLKTVTESDKAYVHNCEILFNRHHVLAESLCLHKLYPYAKMPYSTLQGFFGKAGTGSPWHCANNFNLFFQVEGRKRWNFIDPRYTFNLTPIWRKQCAAFTAGTLTMDEPPFTEELLKHSRCPGLVRATPRYFTYLDGGDVMLNPPLWWHEINNVSDFTIAVATRWGETVQILDDNTNVLCSFVQKMNPYMWGFLGDIVYKQITAVCKTAKAKVPNHLWTTTVLGKYTAFEYGAHFPVNSSDAVASRYL